MFLDNFWFIYLLPVNYKKNTNAKKVFLFFCPLQTYISATDIPELKKKGIIKVGSQSAVGNTA
jgi:hypothetical protein